VHARSSSRTFRRSSSDKTTVKVAESVVVDNCSIDSGERLRRGDCTRLTGEYNDPSVASATLGGAYGTKLGLLSLLESLGATRAYYQAVFTEPIRNCGLAAEPPPVTIRAQNPDCPSSTSCQRNHANTTPSFHSSTRAAEVA
jgi:hypothetical protein